MKRHFLQSGVSFFIFPITHYNKDMTAHKLEEITQFLKTICREAGDRIMRFYNDDSLWQTQTKADNTVLTEADLAANQCLMEAIQQTYPDIYFMSEEIEVPNLTLVAHINTIFWLTRSTAQNLLSKKQANLA
jgi:3'-phosphoadenosine 5'-phosphosulfate (PAPS) 3'-phosphatase